MPYAYARTDGSLGYGPGYVCECVTWQGAEARNGEVISRVLFLCAWQRHPPKGPALPPSCAALCQLFDTIPRGPFFILY